MTYTMKDVMILCVVYNTNLLNRLKPAVIFLVDIFTDEFGSYMENKLEDLDENFKAYFTPTVAQEWICVLPGDQNNIKYSSSGYNMRPGWEDIHI